ncbi:Kdo hydroxylase family protein [Pantoea coffeiphila]|uniref:3-deoxy-D-manno-oct-2-ulosonic acid (Kdo) hydroxylase n=1 Tax=Pantoea coffeiphila TaxID=1465635 RepID=A0A2S9IGJ6_9GAMM|nr:3-deoxy-D-manno-oct-2-ulosonic acid (Kdo) hydroxylase [Pantoea coffeiphila]
MSERPLSHDMVIRSLAMRHWNETVDDARAVDALEQGKVLFLPSLAFPLSTEELTLLTPDLVDPKRKNISFNAQNGKLNGVAQAEKKAQVQALLQRHHDYACQLVSSLLPEYKSALHSPVNSLRLHPITVWRDATSWRKDDTRLHVDAFPSRPNHGERILRIFTNINPHGESRCWRVGEPFPVLAKRFIPRLKRFSPFSSWLQNRLGITKSYRSHYDHLMLQLHDTMKGDENYQQQGPQVTLELPAGSSWICFADQTPHAAMSGQFMLEQTFLLPVAAMKNPDNAPLKILQKLTQRTLI